MRLKERILKIYFRLFLLGFLNFSLFSQSIWTAVQANSFLEAIYIVQGPLCQGHLTSCSSQQSPGILLKLKSLYRLPITTCLSPLCLRLCLFSKACPYYFTSGSSSCIFWFSMSLGCFLGCPASACTSTTCL